MLIALTMAILFLGIFPQPVINTAKPSLQRTLQTNEKVITHSDDISKEGYPILSKTEADMNIGGINGIEMEIKKY